MKSINLKTIQYIQWGVFLLAVLVCFLSIAIKGVEDAWSSNLGAGMLYVGSLFVVGFIQILGAAFIVFGLPNPPKFYRNYLIGIFLLFGVLGLSIYVEYLNGLAFGILAFGLFVSPIIALLYIVIPLIKKF